MNSWTYSNPDLEKENMERQSELIHMFWGYHADRLKNGHPFALDNSMESNDSDGARSNSPRYLANDINDRGLLPLNLINSVRSEVAASPINIISQGITASMWDSLNHINHISHTSQDSRYNAFIHDDDLLRIRHEMDEQGQHIHSFRGTGTVYSGIQVGLNNMTFFSALQYSLPSDHAFDAPRLSHVIAKTTDMNLSLWNMKTSMIKMGILEDPHENLVEAQSPFGISVQVLKDHCKKNAIGCPAMRPIGKQATEILKRHTLYTETYEGRESDSAIQMICTALQQYFNDQVDALFLNLSDEEQSLHIRDADLKILRGKKMLTDK